MKFKIGDKVKVVASKEELGIGRGRYSGCVFTIESVNRTFVYPKLLYGVNDEDCLVFYENELEFVEKDCADAARAVSLWLRMKRFADEHNKNNLGNHIICFDRYDKKLRALRSMGFDKLFQVYFDSEETARQAIEEFKDDLMWYFTEFGKEL